MMMKLFVTSFCGIKSCSLFLTNCSGIGLDELPFEEMSESDFVRL